MLCLSLFFLSIICNRGWFILMLSLYVLFIHYFYLFTFLNHSLSPVLWYTSFNIPSSRSLKLLEGSSVQSNSVRIFLSQIDWDWTFCGRIVAKVRSCTMGLCTIYCLLCFRIIEFAIWTVLLTIMSLWFFYFIYFSKSSRFCYFASH